MEELNTPREIVDLYRAAGGAEPPAALDRAIVEAARAAVEATARRKSWWRSTGGQAGLAFALAAILGIAVVLKVDRPPREAATQLADATPSPQNTSPAPPATAAAPAPQVAQAPEPARPAARAEAVPVKPASREAKQAATPPVESEARALAPPPIHEGSVADTVPASPAASAQSAGAPAAAPSAAARRNAESRADMAAEPQQKSAQEMLDELAQLLDKGRLAEARALLENFRKRYPDHPLPAPIKKALEP